MHFLGKTTGLIVAKGAAIKIQDEVKQAVAKAILEHDFKHVEWIAAGGSYGGFYPADYL